MAKFQKGQSGNPGGRPKAVAEVQELARQHTPDAIKTLAQIMRDPKAPPAARAMASNSILDRAFGRPPQTVDARISHRAVRDMTDAELLTIAAGDPEPDVPTETQH